MSRALATIATISGIQRHPDADRLDIATVRGWRCVVGRDEFQPGETVIFIEPDAWLPEGDPRWDWLMRRNTRTLPDGRRGHVVRTARLRGVISQGLVLKAESWWTHHSDGAQIEPGDDITSELGITLYEPQIPITADIIGPFPTGIPKTDEERIQNFTDQRWRNLLASPRVDVTEKLDGSSVTAWISTDDGRLHVAGRNWELSPDCSTYLKVGGTGAVDWLFEGPQGMYVQGELFGPGIQGNPLKLNEVQFRVFNLGVVGDRGRPFDPGVEPGLLPHKVPTHGQPLPPTRIIEATIGEAVESVDGFPSSFGTNQQAEGIVVRGYSDEGRLLDSVKIINREYLLKDRRHD